MASFPQHPRNHAQTLLLTIIISFLSLHVSTAADNFTASVCMGNPNQTVQVINYRYRANLQSLLDNLVANSYKSTFYNSSYGHAPYTVYGLYLCRGDASPKACQRCISLASDGNWNACANSTKEVLTYRDDCMLRYANYSMYGVYTKASINDAQYLFSSVKMKDPVELNRTFVGMAKGLVQEAAFGSDRMLAMSRVGLSGEDGELYGLAQCTPDIGGADCSGCLETAFWGIEKYWMGDTYSAALLPSCQLRYQNSSFGSNGAAFGSVTWCCYSSLVVYLLVMFLDPVKLRIIA